MSDFDEFDGFHPDPLTPVETERQLRWINRQLSFTRKQLRDLRDAEVKAKHEFQRARRRALLSPDSPRVTRNGFTTAERDAWVEEQCADLMEAYELAATHREAALDHLKTLFQQGTIATSLAKSVGQAYAMAGTGGR